MEHTKDCNHSHDHSHEHEHQHNASSCGHDHSHSHGNTPIVLFGLGLLTYIIGLFVNVEWMSIALNVFTVFAAGYHVISEGFGDTIKNTIKNKKFSPNIHILMTLAAFGAMLIGDFREAALLILIFAGAHFLEDYAENRSKKEITSLLQMNPQEARLINAMNETQIVEVSTLKIGDRVQVLQGDQIPIDGIIESGEVGIDESSITGESIPVTKTVDDMVYGSTIASSGDFIMSVTKDSKDTVFAKIIELVSTTQNNVSNTAAFIKRLEPKYVIGVLLIAPLYFILERFGLGVTSYDAFYKTMVFLTVASPCALAATDIPATLSALSNLAKQGILFKGGSYLSNFSEIKAIAFDKTGTITKGKPEVTDVFFIQEEQESLDILVAMEKKSTHPLAKAIIEKFTVVNTLEVEINNEIGTGLNTTYNNIHYSVGKPSSFESITKEISQKISGYEKQGKTVILFAKDYNVIGVLAIRDEPNVKSSQVINYFRDQGIETVMITGDTVNTANAIASEVGISKIYGNILPENKSQIISELKEEYDMVSMVGDGINDAPALVNANIGFAMGEGSDIAIDVSDAVIMKNDISKLEYTHKISKKLRRIVWENIIFAMGVVVILVVLNFLGKMDLPLGVLIHEGSTLVVIFNGLRMLRVK